MLYEHDIIYKKCECRIKIWQYDRTNNLRREQWMEKYIAYYVSKTIHLFHNYFLVGTLLKRYMLKRR